MNDIRLISKIADLVSDLIYLSNQYSDLEVAEIEKVNSGMNLSLDILHQSRLDYEIILNRTKVCHDEYLKLSDSDDVVKQYSEFFDDELIKAAVNREYSSLKDIYSKTENAFIDLSERKLHFINVLCDRFAREQFSTVIYLTLFSEIDSVYNSVADLLDLLSSELLSYAEVIFAFMGITDSGEQSSVKSTNKISSINTIEMNDLNSSQDNKTMETTNNVISKSTQIKKKEPDDQVNNEPIIITTENETKINIFTAYLNSWKYYSVFDARTKRKDFWYWFLLDSVVIIILNVLIGFGSDGTTGFTGDFFSWIGLNAFGKAVTIIYIIYGFSSLIPSLAIICRRMHSAGRSGAIILFNLIPCVGWIIFVVFASLKADYSPSNRWTDKLEL